MISVAMLVLCQNKEYLAHWNFRYFQAFYSQPVYRYTTGTLKNILIVNKRTTCFFSFVTHKHDAHEETEKIVLS
jgi:hypothetical protein